MGTASKKSKKSTEVKAEEAPAATQAHDLKVSEMGRYDLQALIERAVHNSNRRENWWDSADGRKKIKKAIEEVVPAIAGAFSLGGRRERAASSEFSTPEARRALEVSRLGRQMQLDAYTLAERLIVAEVRRGGIPSNPDDGLTLYDNALVAASSLVAQFYSDQKEMIDRMSAQAELLVERITPDSAPAKAKPSTGGDDPDQLTLDAALAEEVQAPEVEAA